MKTPFLGSSYVARSVNAADNRMVNLYPEILANGRLRPGFVPIGAYMAVQPRTPRT